MAGPGGKKCKGVLELTGKGGPKGIIFSENPAKEGGKAQKTLSESEEISTRRRRMSTLQGRPPRSGEESIWGEGGVLLKGGVWLRPPQFGIVIVVGGEGETPIRDPTGPEKNTQSNGPPLARQRPKKRKKKT